MALLYTSTGLSFCYKEAGAHYNIAPELLRAIALSETGEDPSKIAYNSNGSIDFGLMQINSSWIDVMELDKNALIHDPCYNVMVGAAILKYCIDRYGYNWEAIGCYNANSRPKRISYSWKIYRTLLKLKKDLNTSKGDSN
ncbi:MAG: lytic transglycosylase domain-containing protein [Thermodesulfovibrionales bacterium]|nr:lytic transglycosylase domain-containing protein [Thermodesulfovibrionales bacterium]